MKIVYSPDDDVISELRSKAYLKAFPVNAQLEALTEAAMSRPEKLDKMVETIRHIKTLYPYKKEVS